MLEPAIKEAHNKFLLVYNQLNANKRTLILPCSKQKLKNANCAYELYQGQGYLNVVKKWHKSELDQAFNIFFISAKYGLIHSDEWIAPYDQQLNKDQLEAFSCDKYLQGKARRHIRSMNSDAPLYLIVPQLYQKAFATLAGNSVKNFKTIVPATGGILSQRGQLKRLLIDEIEQADRRSQMDCAAFRTFTNSCPLKETWHLVRVGDWLRPWVSGVGASATFAAPTQVALIRCTNGGNIDIVDVAGCTWSDYQVSAGIKRHGVKVESY